MKKRGSAVFTKKEKIACSAAFAAGSVSLFFSGGHFGTAATAFIWPAAFLFCVRHIEKRFFPAVLFAVMTAVNFIKLFGLSDAGAAVDFAESMLITAVQFLPLLAEHVICRYDKQEDFRKSPLRMLVFPAFYSGLSALFCLTPISATASVAYTLNGFISNKEQVSVIGIFGFLFLLMWFASLLERFVSGLVSGKGIKEILPKKDFYVLLAAVICVSAVGHAVLKPSDNPQTVRIAAAVGTEQPLDEDGEYITIPIEDTLASVERTMADAHSLGAEVLVYTEEAYNIYDYDTDMLTQFVCGNAKEYGMYVFLPLDISASDENSLSDNCIKLINPDGGVEFTYEKSRLVPVIEGDYRKGDGVIPVTELSFADGRRTKTAAFICYDGDSPFYVNSIPADTDILISPSWDWEEIIYYHTPAMKYRAYENGASLVKPTYDGISCICDPTGKTLVQFNSFETGFDHVETADVPLKGIKTPYACALHYFDYVYPLLPVIFCAVLFLRRKKTSDG